MMTIFFRPLLITLIGLMTLSACDNSLDPLDQNKGEYSIYGYLDIYADINYIRVKNLNYNLREDSAGSIDAKVILENLDNRSSETLKDSVVQFDDVTTHNFVSTMDIQPDTEYRVSVENEEGQETSATTTTPKIAETSVKPVVPNCTTYVNLNFDYVESRVDLDLEVGFYFDNREFWINANNFLIDSDEGVRASFRPYDILDERFTLSSPDDIFEEDSLRIFCDRLDEDLFMTQYTHYSSDIYSNDISDTLRITGGTGRFGAYYEDSFSFRIDTTALCPPYPEEVCALGIDYLDL